MFNPLFKQDLKNTLNFSMPYMSSRLLNAVGWFISMAIIAQLGKEFLACSVLVYSTLRFLQLTTWSMMYSVSVVVGHAYGGKKYTDIGKIVRAGFLLACLIGVPATWLLWNIDILLMLLKQPPALVALARPYFHIMAFTVLPSLWYVCFYKFAIGVSRPCLVLGTMLFGTPVGLLFTYALTFGKFGFPALGFVGSAYANVIMYACLCLGLLVYFILRAEFKVFRLFKKFGRTEWRYLKQLFKIGWPIGIEWGAMSLTYTFGTYMVGWLGVTALAAHQVATQYVNFAVMIPYSVAHASAVLVAQGLGTKRSKLIDQIGYVGIGLTATLIGLISLSYWIFPDFLIAAYVNVHDAENVGIIALATTLLMLVGISQLADSAGAVATGALRGFQDTRMPMWISLICNWGIIVPLSYICAFVLNFGVAGIYFGCIVGSIISSIWLISRWKYMCTSEMVIRFLAKNDK